MEEKYKIRFWVISTMVLFFILVMIGFLYLTQVIGFQYNSKRLPIFHDGGDYISAGSGEIRYFCQDNQYSKLESCIFWIDNCAGDGCGRYLLSDNCLERDCVDTIILEEVTKKPQNIQWLCEDKSGGGFSTDDVPEHWGALQKYNCNISIG